MDQPYIGEIRPIGFDYAPKGWAFCNGQQLSINQNQALFSLLGTQFGGNGTTTFALPDLRSRIPVGVGQLLGGGTYLTGQVGGTEAVTLSPDQMPQHIHPFRGTLKTSSSPEETSPNAQLLATGSLNQYSSGAPNAAMAATVTGATANTGNNLGHENRPPYLALNYIIALQGIFPSRQ